MKRKQFVLILLILVFFLIAVCFSRWQKFLVTKIPSGFKVYTNKEAGFKIAFPDNWKIEEEKGSVRFYDQEKEFLWFKILFAKTVAQGFEVAREIKKEEVKIAGILTKKNYLGIDRDLFLEGRSEEEYEKVKDNKMIYSFIKKENKEYFFELVYQTPSEEKLFSQFIKTFRFK